MKIVALKELDLEKRAALTPTGVTKLLKLSGAQVSVEAGLGVSSSFADKDYEKSGATIADRTTLLNTGDVILRIKSPVDSEIAQLKKGAIHLSFLDPFNQLDLVKRFAAQGVGAISLQMIPRITRAQKYDVLSSQASLAGYVAVIQAASRLSKLLPMMMTPSGTIHPARVFIIGAGVAGLQAIATAKRLGAKVEAFDTRPEVEEQVKSLGAKFVKVDLGKTESTKDGYAKALTEEQLQRQREVMARQCSEADMVITTALVFGKKAPVIVTKTMLRGMRPGSVVVDLAAESGGNVEGTIADQEVLVEGVKIIGLANLPSLVATDASLMFSNNLVAFLQDYWSKEKNALVLNREDEIIRGCLLTHEGHLVHPLLQENKERARV